MPGSAFSPAWRSPAFPSGAFPLACKTTQTEGDHAGTACLRLAEAPDSSTPPISSAPQSKTRTACSPAAGSTRMPSPQTYKVCILCPGSEEPPGPVQRPALPGHKPERSHGILAS
jgi:hypothetical protein